MSDLKPPVAALRRRPRTVASGRRPAGATIPAGEREYALASRPCCADEEFGQAPLDGYDEMRLPVPHMYSA